MKSGAGQASLGLSDLRAQSFPKKNIPRRAGPGLRDHRAGTRTRKKIKKNTKNSQVPQLRFESSKANINPGTASAYIFSNCGHIKIEQNYFTIISQVPQQGVGS